MTTLGVGGPAARLVELEREEDLAPILDGAARRKEPVTVLGGGSNLIVGDAGFPGLVVRVMTRGITVRVAVGRVTLQVEAGEDWDALVARSVDEGWRGLESLSGIPGLVGATPIQNVGAYGQEVSQTLSWVRVYDRHEREFQEIDARDCAFGYRTSRFRGSSRYVVTRVCFALDKAAEGVVRYAELARALAVREGETAPLGRVRETVIALRRSKGMVVDPADPESRSAGSFFVNPVVDASVVERIMAAAGEPPPRFGAGEGRWKVAAAWLVERAGFPKGYGIGRAGISRKHALALVNRGGATAGEILQLARSVRAGVKSRFGVDLEPEPVLVGTSWD